MSEKVAKVEGVVGLNTAIREEHKHRMAWKAIENDYRDYISDVYMIQSPMVTFTNGLLSDYFMDNAMKEMSVGVIENINPLLSLSGVVKTNPNNEYNIDTRIGLIANQMYASSLFNASKFNSERRINNVALGHYISVGTDSIYGDTESNIGRLSSMFEIDKVTGRIAGEFGDYIPGGAKFVHDFTGNDTYNFNADFVFNHVAQNPYSSLIVNDINMAYASHDLEEGKLYTSNHYFKSKIGYIDATTEEIYDNNEQNSDNTLIHYHHYEGDIRERFLDVNEVGLNEEHTEVFTPITNMNKNSLLKKTNDMFINHKIQTMVGRFHTSQDIEDNVNVTLTDTAKSQYGNSHGRNLLKRKHANSITNGFENPYCRVWTYHHQYDNYRKLIRPFTKEEDEGSIALNNYEMQSFNKAFRSNVSDKGVNYERGDFYLARNTVLRDNGLVNITPEFDNHGERIKNCMFSIENLAWKDVPNIGKNGSKYLSREQRGDNGGRIMWFPPYGLDFSESVNSQWNSNTFIGRGEPVYTYSNTERTGTLSFILLIDHPNIINEMYNKDGNPRNVKYPDESTNTIDDDTILRYFAGCEPIEPIVEKKEPEKEEQKEEEIELETSKKIQIVLYYPNNYSGHMNECNNYLESDTKKEPNYASFRELYDDDFGEYIIGGIDCGFDAKNMYGYEMFPNDKEGISKGNVGMGNMAKKENLMNGTKNTHRTVCDSADYDGDDKEKRRFFYRTDDDLLQQHLHTGDTISLNNSYCDYATYGLNTIPDRNVENQYVFADLYYASFENSTDPKKQACIKYIEEHDTNGEIRKRAKELSNIIKIIKKYLDEHNDEKKTEYDNKKRGIIITAYGYATKQDSGNTLMLAERRKETLVNYYWSNTLKCGFTYFNGDCKGIDVNPGIIKTSANDTINSLSAKSARWAMLEIEIKNYEQVKMSYMNADAANNTEKEEISEEEKTWEDILTLCGEGDKEFEKFAKKDYSKFLFVREKIEMVIKNQVNLFGKKNFDELYKYCKESDVNKKDVYSNIYPVIKTLNSITDYENECQYYVKFLISTLEGKSIKKDYNNIYDFLYNDKNIKDAKKFIFLFNDYIRNGDINYSKNKEMEKYFENFEKDYEDYAENKRQAEIQKEIENYNQKLINTKEKRNNNKQKLLEKEQENLRNVLNMKGRRLISDVRYENEADYFRKIKTEDPLVFKKIIEKFKYFDPAFHSMSPEGFNARLNFLQQCMRQGHTLEQNSSNGLAATAGNLAFGRMPVCVLRIGDFINTRIIIESMSINYSENGGMTWDLNPEGAGVQPMMAKVSLNIKILGGQSLEGPISKLQNAISFNYYANTGVYDNRADRAHPIMTIGNPNDNTVYGYTHVEKAEADLKQNQKDTLNYLTKYDYTWTPYQRDNS